MGWAGLPVIATLMWPRVQSRAAPKIKTTTTQNATLRCPQLGPAHLVRLALVCTAATQHDSVILIFLVCLLRGDIAQ